MQSNTKSTFKIASAKENTYTKFSSTNFSETSYDEVILKL